MKAYQYILFGLIVLILIGVDLILVRRTVLYKEEIALKDSVITSVMVSSNKFRYIKSSLDWSFRYGGVKIQDQQIVDTMGRKLSIGEVVQGGSVLVYRYHTLHCQTCIVFGISKLNDFVDTTGSQPAIFAQYDALHSFKVANRTLNASKMPIYNVQGTLAPDTLVAPYYFVIHQDLTISDVFVPEKSFPDITRQYLETVRKKYFDHLPE